MTADQPLELEPFNRPPNAVIRMPGSKSHTNRALLCAALADGPSVLSGALLANDTWAMIKPLQTLGVEIGVEQSSNELAVGGYLGTRIGQSDDHDPLVLNVNQSGTTSRFLLPVLAGLRGLFLLDGDPQLRARPFGPQLKVLRTLGAEISGDGLPLQITGQPLAASTVSVDASSSSQFLSGLLIAAPTFSGETEIERTGDLVSRPYIELTIDTMASFGATVESNADLTNFRIKPQPYQPARCQIEPDASAASYFFAAAAVTGGTVRINGLSPNSVQGDVGFVQILEQMGASVTTGSDFIEVSGTGTLNGVTVDMNDISDTAQTLAVVATFATSPTEISGIGFIRAKETDRISAVVSELQRRGIQATEHSDGLTIEPGTPSPGVVETYDDHRMAMSFSLLGLVHRGIKIANPTCVAKTFPDFFSVLESIRL